MLKIFVLLVLCSLSVSAQQYGDWEEEFRGTVRPSSEFSGVSIMQLELLTSGLQKVGKFWIGGELEYRHLLQGELATKINNFNPDFGTFPSVHAGVSIAAPYVKITVTYDEGLPPLYWLQENDKVYWNAHDAQKLLDICGANDPDDWDYNDCENHPRNLSQLRSFDSLLYYNLDEYYDYDGAENTPSPKELDIEYQKRLVASDGPVVDYFKGENNRVSNGNYGVTMTARVWHLYGELIVSQRYSQVLFNAYVDIPYKKIRFGGGVYVYDNNEGERIGLPYLKFGIDYIQVRTAGNPIFWSPIQGSYAKGGRNFKMSLFSSVRFGLGEPKETDL